MGTPQAARGAVAPPPPQSSQPNSQAAARAIIELGQQLFDALKLWLFLFYGLSALVSPKGQRQQNGRTAILLFVLATFVGFFAMSVFYGLVNLAILGVLLAFMTASRWTNKKEGRWARQARKFFQLIAFVLALVFLLGPLLIWLGLLGVWMPQERITLSATQVIEPVYVLSYDDHWTKYMDGAHKVHIVRTPDISRRELVDGPRSAWHKTPYAMWQERRTRSNASRPSTLDGVMSPPTAFARSATSTAAISPISRPKP